MLEIHISSIAVRAFLMPGFQHTEHFHVADSVLFSTQGVLPDKARLPPLAGELIRCCCKRFCNYRITDSPSVIMVKKLRTVFLWWEKLDLNQRSLAATDLQPAPIDQTLAFSHMWWALQESDLGRADLQSAALPTELRTRGVRDRTRTDGLQGHNLAL